ncbi:MAG: hypothetical protein AB8G05_19830 [Oligoflexales bacterium]
MFEMTAEWWFSEPSVYVINLGKNGAYNSISPFEFLAAFVSAVKIHDSLHPFTQELVKVTRSEGLKLGKERFNTWDLQKHLKESPPPSGEHKVDKFKLTLDELCLGVVFIFSVMDIYEDDGLGDPRVFLLEKLNKLLSKGEQ